MQGKSVGRHIPSIGTSRLDRIQQLNETLHPPFLRQVDKDFAAELVACDASWRKVVTMSIGAGLPVPGMSSSLSYFDTYRRERLPANLVQAQRDFFGSHTYQRTDEPGGAWYHTVWDETFGSADSITTSSYNV